MKPKGKCNSDNWKTPKDFYDKLNAEFHFDFDPCPYSEGDPLFDGLSVPWGIRNFVNPPYSRKLKDAFVRKALEESRTGKICVLLLPVCTSSELFHDVIKPHAREIRFVRKRLRFESAAKSKFDAGFDSMLVVFGWCECEVFAHTKGLHT